MPHIDEIMNENPGDSPLSSWIQELSGRLVCILTFGCTYNEGDSDRLRSILVHAGCPIVETPAEAEVVFLNSCIVIEKTERKMIRLLRELGEKYLWITGCLPSARPDILAEFPSARILSPDEIHAASRQSSPCSADNIAVVQIGPGCLGECSYCITRLARGQIRSIPESEILSQIQTAVDNGATEIRLTGQDISAYGYDQGNPSLPSLLRGINGISGKFRVRLGMMNPATLAPIVREVAESLHGEKFFRFIHLPIQSGSDCVLYRMKRGYHVHEYLEMIRIIRGFVPDVSIATDIIAGFADETGDEFQASCDLLSLLMPDVVNITRYSYRPGSTASRKGELPDRIRKDRSRELIMIGYSILKEKKQKMIGEIFEVLITEEVRPGTVMGRTMNYTGVVIGQMLPIGGWYQVIITEERIHYLTGMVVR